MELFSISCTTCKTRLKVRDAAAIGKILDCPKCGAFVMIEAPPGWNGVPAEHGVSAGTAAPVALPSGIGKQPASVAPPPAESTFDDAASLLSDAPAKREAAFAATAPSVVLVAQAASLPTEAVGQAASLPTEAGSFGHANVGYEAARESAEIASEVAASGGAFLPQWLSMGVAAVAGVGLALGLFVFAVWFFSEGERQLVVAVSPAVPASGETRLPETDSTAKTADDAQPEHPHTTEPAPGGPTKVSTTPETDPSRAEPSETPGAGDVAAKPAKPPASVKPAGPASTKPAVPAESDVPVEPRPAEPIDPKTVSSALKKFAPFIDGEPLPASEPASEASAGKPTVSPGLDAALPARSDESARSRPEPRQVDVPARLAEKLAHVEFQNVPLVDFIQFVSDLSTIPITLDLEALQFVGASPERPVSVNLRDASVGAILKDALAPLGLGYELTAGGLLVVKPGPADGKPRSINYAVADLGGDDADRLADLGAWATSLVAPESWEPAGGAGTLAANVEKGALVVQQSEAVHFQMVLFCEKLRVARGLAPRSKFDKSLFRLEPRVARSATGLATPISLNFGQPTPLVRILDRLGKAAGVRIVVDWQAAATVGWSCEAEATVVADKLPLGETLAALLRPMDLTYRVVGDGVVQVTSPRVLESRLELEVYPVADLLTEKVDGPRLAEQIKAALGEELFPESGLGGAIRFDVPSKSLLVSLPQPRHGELIKLLGEWRGAK